MNILTVDLSIIIPMYNCGKVIIRCLDSIDYQDAEIIVVDDGSNDDGAIVVNRYAKTHSNVQLIQKENGGVSSARNVGIANAHGKYIMFIDADDYVGKDGIIRMINLALEEDVDVLKYACLYLDAKSPENHSSLKETPFSTRHYIGVAEALRHYKLSDYYIWDGLFKRSVIEENCIRFDEDLHLHEDDVFMGKIYCVSSKVIVTDFPLYRYVKSSLYSSTHNQSQERNRILIQSGLLAISHRSQFIKEHLFSEVFPYERLKYMRWVCSPCQAVEAGYSYKEYRQILEQFKNMKIWPVSYKWIKVARLDYSWKVYLKKILFTFLLNHPHISYPIAKMKSRR